MAEQQTKRMSLVQLTFIVAVNMMGSGIIMLPTNMAQVGAISLLSWIVTAVGSMAIAYGFAQAGIFNQRPGGMSAYAEDAYGKSGFFLVFLLYFLSLAIGNVAIAISALGYLSAFVPWLTSTPIMTCIGVIALLWLTTVANFGGPSVTGKIGSITVWGVIIPVGFLSFGGWLWFSSETFAAAWNPHGLSTGEGMVSSIALTLWAFLGMESAAQNSAAVENPKRNVPLACLFGTLGAAVVYILSTTVIQGIVPNAELANSTGPFALAYAKMFNPVIGNIIMALAVMACLGSLLGWQFTIAQTGKSAAEDRMFPSFFTKVNSMGAPITGMIVLGVVQSLLALSTISPTLSEQFSALVNLAVVTNVIPYVISLSAVFVMMKSAGVPQGKYRLNTVILLIAMLYSTYAIYASGHDAVMGGTLVMAVTFIIWGFIAFRFASKQGAAAAASLIVALMLLMPAMSASAATLDQVKTSGKLLLGYREDARPFSYEDSGKAAGYSVALCEKIADAIKTELALPALTVEWVKVTAEDRFSALQQGKIDILCGAATATLERRKTVSFSIPVFPSGIGAVLRWDAPAPLRDVLSGTPPTGPVWRGSPARILDKKTFSVVTGTTGETWLADRLKTFQIDATTAPVADYEAGIKDVLERKADVFFGDRPILLEAAQNGPSADELVVLDRVFTHESLALAVRRDDDDMRLIVDRALSQLFRSADFREIYVKWFGEMDDGTASFFQQSALPD
jgi:putrescine:ornithine antiporter